MMQQYAGPLNPGDMAIRANELSPGISALLMKQMRNNAGSGIYQLPVAKQPNPDFYNSALDNVQNNIRTAARTVNAMAPEGERLAFVNPQEEGILKLLGGAGEPEPVTGIPSYFRASQFSGPSSPGTSSSGGMRSSGASSQGSAFGGGAFRGGGGGGNNRNNQAERDQILRDIDKAMEQKEAQEKAKAAYVMTGPANTQFTQDAKGLAAAITEATGPAYADQAKGAITSFIGAGGVGADGMYDPMVAAKNLIAKAKELPEGDAKKAYKDMADALKYSLGSFDYGGKTLFGMGDGYYLGDDTKNILRAAKTYGQLPRDKTFLEKAGDVISGVGITGLLSKLFGGGKKLEDMTLEELKDFYDKQDAMRAAEEMRRRDRGGDSGRAQAPAVIPEEEEEEEEEDILDFFDYYRRFKQPMSYEDIIKRAYEGSSGPLLESFQEAIDREQE
jgi:hypothetical protein